MTAEQQQDGAAERLHERLAALDADGYWRDTEQFRDDIGAVLAERTALAARVAKLTAKAQEPHQGLTEDAFVQLLSERTGQPVLLCIGDSRPIAGGIHAGYALDSIKLGDKEVGRVTLQTVFPDYVITGPTPETEARRQQLLAELDAMEAALGAAPEVVIGAGSPETSALTHCPTCGAPEWLADGRRGWNPVDVECEVCAGTYAAETEES